MTKFVLVAMMTVIVATIFSITILKGGFIHPEAETFIPHYLSQHPLPELIFSPEHTDWGLYQARELSYFFDWLDCRFISWSVANGMPHFLSITHYLLCAAMALGIALFARGGLHLSSSASLGLAGLWLTHPCVLLGGTYYRSAKILVASAILCACLASWHYLKAPKSSSGQAWGCLAVVALSLVCAGLADRQGFFLAAAFGLWLCLRAWWLKHEACWPLAAAGFFATGVIVGYTYLIGPWLIHRIDGQPPSLSYMSLPWATALTDPVMIKSLVFLAPRAALYAVGTTIGGLPWLLVLAVIGWAAWHFSSTPGCNQPPPSHPLLRTVWWLLLPSGIIAMYALMALRHKAVVQLAEFQIIYYPLPLVMLTVGALAISIGTAFHSGRISQRALVAALWLLVASNLGNLPQYRLSYATSVYANEIAAGPKNIALLRKRMVPPDSGPAMQALSQAAGWLPSSQP